MNAKPNFCSVNPDLHLAFDVGHSSIGWAVLQARPNSQPATPSLLGTGVVIFGADDCLAVKRRQNRQARRHARATRQRIARIEQLLAHLGVLTPEQLADAHQQAGGDSFAWQRAAEILKAARDGQPLPAITWPELWDILRWYAHNRGYFAPPWANREEDEEEEPTEADPKRPKKQPTVAELLNKKGEISPKEMMIMGLGLMHGEHPDAKLKAETMAETIAAYTAWYDREVARWQQGQRQDKPRHFKGLKAAFPRDTVVWPEVRALLTALKGKLPGLDDALLRTLLGNDVDPLKDRDAWRTIPCPAIKLPKRYHGGLLFGQSIPRFNNRIIGVCPIWFAVCQDLCLHHPEITQDDPLRREKEAVVQAFEQWLPRAKKANERRSPEKQKSPEALIAEFAAKQSKLPAKASPEFLRFRWAMQLANVFGAAPGERETRPLTANERKQLTTLAKKQGAFTKGEFKEAVRKAAGWPEKGGRDNLDALLLHPDAEKALIFDPVQAALRKHPLADAFFALPPQFLKRLRGKLARGKEVKPQAVRGWLGGAQAPRLQPTAPSPSVSDPLAAFDAAVQRVLDAANTKRSENQAPLTREQLLGEPLTARFPKGRAPYARPVLRQAYEEVMKGWHPRAEKSDRQPRGCLCQTNELKEAQLQRRLEEQTNNHLIRHRLLILAGEPPKANAKPEEERRRFKGLLHDLVQEFANGDQSRIASLTIEVNRELRDLSGKTREQQAGDIRDRLRNFKDVAAKVEEACRRRGIPCTAGLIRKARIAEDLKWTCPYTKVQYCLDDLIDGRVDKDHIIPHADRQSDSLDSLVLTFGEVNRMKGKRTAVEFIKEFGGSEVAGTVMSCGKLARLSIQSFAAYKKHVETLDTMGTHEDDKARKRRRKDRLMLEHYEEKEFTPRDLTVTSHLVRLGAQVLQRAYPPDQRPRVISLPGAVTGEIRKAWKVTGCLEAANPAVMEEVEERNPDTGELQKVRRPKKKDDIRGITHLHHALDACVLGLASLYFPRHGAVWSAAVRAGQHAATATDDNERPLWQAMTKRRPTAQEVALLRATGLYDGPDPNGRMQLRDLPAELKAQIRQRLAEKRVVQHIPADMSGIKVGETTWGIGEVKDGRVSLHQYGPRDPKTGLRKKKPEEFATGKLLGLNPPGDDGKLKRQKGVRVITDNFGVAILDHAPEGEEKFVVIPWHRVWHRLEVLKARNAGRPPRVLRPGALVRLSNTKPNRKRDGIWRIYTTQATLKVDFVAVDAVERKKKGDEVWREVSLESLGADNIQCLQRKLIGYSQN